MLRVLQTMAVGMGIWFGIPWVIAIMGAGVLIGIPLLMLDHLPVFHQTFVAMGVTEETSDLDIQPVRIDWASDGEHKVLTLNLHNRSGETWDRFGIECRTNTGWEHFADLSGIMAGETTTRTYAIDSTTATEAHDCKLAMHMRGKPHGYDTTAAFQYGDGGWGNRIPVTNPNPDTTGVDPNIDYN